MKNYALIVQGLTDLLQESYTQNYKHNTSKLLNKLVENSELKKLYAVVDNLKRGTPDEEEVEAYINENIRFASEIKYNKIPYPFDAKVESDDPLYNAIGVILFEKKNAFNLDRFNSAYKTVKQNLIESVRQKREIDSTQKQLSENLKVIDKKDKMLVEAIIQAAPEQKVAIFEAAKRDCITLIDSHIKETEEVELKLKMYETKDVILSMDYQDKSFAHDIAKIYNFTKELSC